MSRKQKKALLRGLMMIAAIIMTVCLLSYLLRRGETLSELERKSPTSENTTTEVDIENSSESTEPSMEGEVCFEAETINESLVESEEIPLTENEFYHEPLSEEVKKRITGCSYPKDDTTCVIHYEDLRLLHVLYYNFNDREKRGELICHESIADDLLDIFKELHRNRYQIERIALVDEYSGDDELSMKDNNTSCFNYRETASGRLSQHAYGVAVDLNPFYNPYVRYNKDGSLNISPEGSEYYTDRDKEFAYKITRDDLACQLFMEHGFLWGGNWNSSKDYQHFEKPLK